MVGLHLMQSLFGVTQCNSYYHIKGGFTLRVILDGGPWSQEHRDRFKMIASKIESVDHTSLGPCLPRCSPKRVLSSELHFLVRTSIVSLQYHVMYETPHFASPWSWILILKAFGLIYTF